MIRTVVLMASLAGLAGAEVTHVYFVWPDMTKNLGVAGAILMLVLQGFLLIALTALVLIVRRQGR